MKIVDTERLLDSMKVGFEFEFFSEMRAKDISSELSIVLNKNVQFIRPIKIFGDKVEMAHHTDVSVSDTIFKLDFDYSGGKDMYELITGPLQWREARIIFMKICAWIDQNGYTNDRSGFHFNISISDSKTPVRIERLNKLKFCLNYDEESIFEHFPERRDNIYAKSIKFFVPANKLIPYTSYTEIEDNLITPNSKYYGVNFTKLSKRYLEFRYIGGKDYQQKRNEILSIIESSYIQLYRNCENPELTNEDKQELIPHKKKLIEITSSILTPQVFRHQYPDLQIYVDLYENMDFFSMNWSSYQEFLFNVIYFGKVTKAKINYDTDASRYQIMDSTLMDGEYLPNTEFIRCKLQGVYDSAYFYDCIFNKADVSNSTFDKRNIMHDGRVKNSFMLTNKIRFKNCYILNNQLPVKGEYENSVISSGIISKNTIMKNTKIVNVIKN